MADRDRVLIVVPTVAGREDELRACLSSHAHPRAVLRIERGHASCGDAWNAGARAALREHSRRPLDAVLFTADDLIAHPGYLDVALSMLHLHELPGAFVYDEDGRRHDDDGPPAATVPFSRVPLLPMHLVRALFPMPPLHYYSDLWLGERARELGWNTRLVRSFAFTHTWAQAGRIASDERDLRLLRSLGSR